METPSARANFSELTPSAIRLARIQAPTRKSVGFKSIHDEKSWPAAMLALHTSHECHTHVWLHWFATKSASLKRRQRRARQARSRSGNMTLRRIALGVSSEKLARALGVSIQQVIAWELGVTRIGA